MKNDAASRLAGLTLLLALVAASGCAAKAGGSAAGSGGDGAGGSNPGDPEPADMKGMTAAHNAARAAVMPVATPSLPPMAWSATVAASAQAFTDNCVFADTERALRLQRLRRQRDLRPGPGGRRVGGRGRELRLCHQHLRCQAMSAGTTRRSCGGIASELGCGMTTCTDNSPFGGSGAWQLWVCNYNPAGNYVGMKPY